MDKCKVSVLFEMILMQISISGNMNKVKFSCYARYHVFVPELKKVSGENLLQSRNWADGQLSSHCADVGVDLTWNCVQFSIGYVNYSGEDKLLHHKVILSWDNNSQYSGDMISSLATVPKKHHLNFDSWIGQY